MSLPTITILTLLVWSRTTVTAPTPLPTPQLVVPTISDMTDMYYPSTTNTIDVSIQPIETTTTANIEDGDKVSEPSIPDPPTTMVTVLIATAAATTTGVTSEEGDDFVTNSALPTPTTTLMSVSMSTPTPMSEAKVSTVGIGDKEEEGIDVDVDFDGDQDEDTGTGRRTGVSVTSRRKCPKMNFLWFPIC
ncbi:hypothetical protein RBB50_006330 [Rhinocladiella similis]